MHKTASNVLNRLFVLSLCLLLLISFSSPVEAESNEKQYVASINSDVYHVVGCGQANRIQGYNRIYFSSRSEAIASGRRACYYCGDDYVYTGNSTDPEYSHAISLKSEVTNTNNSRNKDKTETRLYIAFGFAFNIALWYFAKKISIRFRFLDSVCSHLPDSIVVIICFILAIALGVFTIFVMFGFGNLLYEALLENDTRKAVQIVIVDVVFVFLLALNSKK